MHMIPEIGFFEKAVIAINAWASTVNPMPPTISAIPNDGIICSCVSFKSEA